LYLFCFNAIDQKVKYKDGVAFDAFEDPEQRYRQRYVDLVVNEGIKDIFIKRTKVYQSMRDYFNAEGLFEGKSDDHWINQYWNKEESRWITIDVDGSLEDYLRFDAYDMPDGVFDFSLLVLIG